MQAIELENNTLVELSTLFARIPFRQHSDLAQQVGCALTETGLIAVSAFGETTVPGMYAAGDNSSGVRQLVLASANGMTAAATVNRELIQNDLAVRRIN